VRRDWLRGEQLVVFRTHIDARRVVRRQIDRNDNGSTTNTAIFDILLIFDRAIDKQLYFFTAVRALRNDGIDMLHSYPHRLSVAIAIATTMTTT